MSEKKSEFIAIETVPNDYSFNVFGNSVDRKISKTNLFAQIKEESFAPFIYPSIELLQAADLEADEDNPTYVRCEETEYRLYKITNLAAGVDDITLDNGNTATYQVEYRDIGFVVGPATSVAGSLAIFTDTGGAQLDDLLVPTNAGKAFMQAADGASVTFPRKNADNTVSMLGASTYFDAIKQVSAVGYAGAIKTADNTAALAQSATDMALTPANLAALKASNAETLAGTDDTKYITSENLQVKIDDELSDKPTVIENVAALASTPVVPGRTYYLKEYHAGTGKYGGSLAGKAGSTTYDNIRTFAGSGGYFERINYIEDQVIINLFDYIPVSERGAILDRTTTYNASAAFRAASQAIEDAVGGVLWIPKGKYIVGEQDFAGATGLGYSYRARDVINIQDCLSVTIEGNGAEIVVADGMKYGSFDPVSGAPASPTTPYYNWDFVADVGFILLLKNNISVKISGLRINGNLSELIIGGDWGDVDRQIAGTGVFVWGNSSVIIQDVFCDYLPLDGFQVKRTVDGSETDLYPHTLISCKSRYNGRQGLSWIGGNHITMIDCDMSHTGQNGYVQSLPGAGLDIEPESSIGRNGAFINCRFNDNYGPGVLASAGDSADCNFVGCEMIGTTSYSGWVQFPRYTFTSCKIVGQWIWPGGNSDPENAAKWINCKFLMIPSESPTGAIFGTFMNFDSSLNVSFSNCTFSSSSGYVLPFSNAGLNGASYNNCTFNQDGSGSFVTRGNFTGVTKINHSGTWDYTGSKFSGTIIENGTVKTGVWSNDPTVIQNGFGTPTGVARIANFPGATATLLQTSQAVADILTILKDKGMTEA